MVIKFTSEQLQPTCFKNIFLLKLSNGAEYYVKQTRSTEYKLHKKAYDFNVGQGPVDFYFQGTKFFLLSKRYIILK